MIVPLIHAPVPLPNVYIKVMSGARKKSSAYIHILYDDMGLHTTLVIYTMKSVPFSPLRPCDGHDPHPRLSFPHHAHHPNHYAYLAGKQRMQLQW